MYNFFKKNKFQILRFLISGSLASLINYLVYTIIYLSFKNIILASLLGYLIGLIISFILSKIWVFKDKTRLKISKSFLIFITIYFIGGLEMSLVINLLIDVLDSYRKAWIFGAIIAALNNYLGSRYLLFKGRS